MKIKTILIDGKPFTYEDELADMSYDGLGGISPEDGKNLLYKTKELFDECGIEFYLAFGTLLGAVREHAIIHGDEYVDVMCPQEDKLRSSLPFLSQHGYEVCRIIEGELYSFRINKNSYIDVYIIRPLHNSIWSIYCCCLSGLVTPRKFFEKIIDIEFLGTTFKSPVNPEKLVEFWYGKDWRVPKSGKKYYYEVKSHWYWKNRIKPRLQELVLWPYWRHIISPNYQSMADSLLKWKKFKANLK